MANPLLDDGRYRDFAERYPVGTSRVESVSSADGRPFDPIVQWLGRIPYTKSKWDDKMREAEAVSGAVGSLSGILSRAPGALRGLDEAVSLRDRGKSPRTILMETGWWKGADGNWQQEVTDRGMKLKTDSAFIPFGTTGNFYPKFAKDARLADVMEHPPLFQHYPNLKDVRVGGEISDWNVLGNWNPSAHQINLNPGRPRTVDEIKDTLLHEITHATQSMEGWGNGAWVEKFLPKNYKALQDDAARELYSLYHHPELKDVSRNELTRMQDIARQYLVAGAENLPPGDLLPLSQFFATYPSGGRVLLEAMKKQQIIDDLDSQAWKNYRNTTGEAEARAVEVRRALPAQERYVNPFWEELNRQAHKNDRIPGDILPWNPR